MEGREVARRARRLHGTDAFGREQHGGFWRKHVAVPASALGQLTSLTTLKPSRSPPFVGADYPGLVAAMPVQSSLTELELRGLCVQTASLQALGNALRDCKGFRRLDMRELEWLRAATAPSVYVVELLGTGCPAASLDVSCAEAAPLEPGAAAHVRDPLLPAALVQCAALARVCVRNGRMGPEGMSRLADVAPRCKALAVLELESNDMADEGASKLAAALQHCGKLQR